jgi:hypothetical protein
MNDCPSCEAARANRASGLIRIGCMGCKARSLADSPQYFASRKAGRLLPEYVAAMDRAFPGMAPTDAHAMVRLWAL